MPAMPARCHTVSARKVPKRSRMSETCVPGHERVGLAERELGAAQRHVDHHAVEIAALGLERPHPHDADALVAAALGGIDSAAGAAVLAMASISLAFGEQGSLGGKH